MSNNIKVKISPLPYYNKYASCEYILCGIDFFVTCDSVEHHFRSESSNNCIKELLSEITDFLSGKLTPQTELYYYIPWIAGNYCVYPYSFKIVDSHTLSFRYKCNQNDTEFDFECDIDKGDIISIQEQIAEQSSKIDWDALGKSILYSIKFPDRDFEWCYSAKALCQSLNEVCLGKSIKAIYVTSMNYADPLSIQENYVNYYLGSELIIQLGDTLIDLLLFASGLFKWRMFQNTEYTTIGPTLKHIEDGDEEFCDIGNVYNMFKAEYANSNITQVVVTDTEYWPWNAKGFDKSKLGNPIELPNSICIKLSNGCTLSLHGLTDDFCIKLSPA